MKIAYLMQTGVPEIHRHPLSGPAAHVYHVFQELTALGHDLTLLARMDGQIFQSRDLQQFRPVIVPAVDRGPIRLFERAVRRVQYELKLPYAGMFEAFRFALACRSVVAGCDLLYERMGWMGYGGAIAARWLKIPLVWEVNGDHLDEFESLGIAPEGGQRWIALQVMAWAARQTATVVATGEGWRRRFIERWDTPPERVHVVENGSQVVDLLRREQLRTFQSPAADDPVHVVYLGALEPWHGVEILLQAMAKARQHSNAIHLSIIGDGSERSRLEELTARLGLSGAVTFRGRLPLEEAVQWLAQAEIGASPYCGRVEYSGLKLLDYKAAGLATVASGRDGEPAVLRHGETGWIVPPCDVDALAGALVHLAQTPHQRRRIGQQARLEAEAIHSWRHTAEQLDRLFRTLAGESGRSHTQTVRQTQGEPVSDGRIPTR